MNTQKNHTKKVLMTQITMTVVITHLKLGPSESDLGFPGSSDGKASAYNAGDPGSIPGSGRSPGEGNGTLLQYSCLENPMGGGAW